MWGDTRDDPSRLRYHIYYTTSEDGGKTWGFELEDLGLKERDARVSDFASNPNHAFPGGRFLGDYFSIKATEDDVYLVWADARLGEFGGVNQKIAFARRRPVPSPEVFINPPAGPGGQEVTLQGFNFQPDMNIFIRVGGVLVSTQRTNREGRFTAPVFIPISGEGGHGGGRFRRFGQRGHKLLFHGVRLRFHSKATEGDHQGAGSLNWDPTAGL